MKFLATFAFILGSIIVIAQDTTVVQTFTFDDITQRRGEFVFPGEEESFRKILLYYTLKCDPQTQQDQFDCGEWDYLTYNFVYDHTGNLDSNLISHPSFYVGTETPAEFGYQSNPLYNYYQSYQYFTVIDEVIEENIFTVGQGANSEPEFLSENIAARRMQFILTPTELISAGLSEGSIERLALETGAGTAGDKHIRINVGLTPSESLMGFTDEPLATVFDQTIQIEPNTTTTFNLLEPFDWDGASSIVVELLIENSGEDTADCALMADEAPENSAWASTTPDGFLEFSNGDFLRVPVDGSDFGSQITVSLWVYGDPEQLPANTYLFEATDETGDRSLNVHLPWSNGRVYWDAGAGSGYDRIDKAASASEYSGQWNHWAFTKNSETGEMRIYLNGALWHSGSGFDRPIGELHSFNIGKGVSSNNGFPGKIDEFRVWNVELDEATIAEWMHKGIDATHPQFGGLQLYYNFDQSDAVSDISGNQMDAVIFGSPFLQSYASEELSFDVQPLSSRPQLSFYTGDYTSHIDSALVVDSILQPAVSVVEYVTNGQVLEGLESEWYWPEGCSYWFDPDNTLIDSLCFAAEGVLVNGTSEYFGPAFEVIERWEIGRFITPYGINLDLPEEGFTWVYDVTDYAHLLRDTVDLQMGNQQELIDAKFLMISGTPPREVLRVNKVWGDMASRSYSALDNDDVLSATDVPVLPETQQLMLKTRLTGHGHQSNNGEYPHCCEWKDNTHYLYVNGNEVADWHIWQTHDCALNPVYPQGGTWPGSREGWCPGDLVKDNDFNLSGYLGGNSINLDYGITPVPSNNQGMGSGNYVIAMHLFEYANASHNLDAEIYNVLNPSKAQYFQRHNPICREPRVEIRNNGSETLTSATITYGVSGGEPLSYQWSGNLETMDSEIITLPVNSSEFWEGDENHIFTATVSNPNGGADGYAANDSYDSPFNMAPEYPFDFIVYFKTNNFPQQNWYTVKDMNGNIVFEHDDMDPTTVYRDTMDLAPGCYTFEFMDTGNDGLAYWANPAQGSGFLRFKINGGGFIENMNPDFGRSVIRAFTVGDVTSLYDVERPGADVNLFPNPSNGAINLELSEFDGKCTLEVYDPLGQLILQEQLVVSDYLLHELDFSGKPTGMYFFKIFNEDFAKTEKVVLK